MSHAPSTHRRNLLPGATRPRRRRAIATLVVLLLISIALALSYSIMRAQSTAVAIQRNANLTLAARQAAMVGVTAGLKRMHVWDTHDSGRSWGGVGSTLKKSLSKTERFEVRFATGDPSLVTGDPWLTSDAPTLIADHPDRDDFPYRVTLFVTGYAADLNDSTRVATHRARAVVRLVPRKLADEPSLWSEVLQNTVYQWYPDEYDVGVPFRIEGRQRIQGQLTLARDYPWPHDVRERYLKDLHRMTEAVGTTDFRPMNGPLRLMSILQEWGLSDILSTSRAVSVENTYPSWSSAPSSPTQITNYQIYPGGKSYRVGTLGRELANVEVKADPRDNPLGFFLRNGDVHLKNNVTIHGTLLARGTSSGDVSVEGKNVRLLAPELPALAGTKSPVRLPVVVAESDVRFAAGSQAIVTGVIALYDEFGIPMSSQNGLAVSGTTRIADGTLAADGNCCAVRAVDLNTVDPKQVPIGARFRVSTAGNSTLYTVTKRTPAEGSPTVSIEFTPNWGSPTPKKNDEICFIPAADATGTVVTIRGRVVAREVKIGGNARWVNSQEWWADQYSAFMDQLTAAAQVRIVHFPVWLQQKHGMMPWASSTIKPEPAEYGQVCYHWKNSYDPIYVPHPDDEGLRWELLEWTDNP